MDAEKVFVLSEGEDSEFSDLSTGTSFMGSHCSAVTETPVKDCTEGRTAIILTFPLALFFIGSHCSAATETPVKAASYRGGQLLY
jgi:hypothetical protein